MKKNAECTKMIIAPEGISKISEKSKPSTAPTMPIISEYIVICVKVREISFAEADGIIKNEAISTMPTSLTESTITKLIIAESIISARTTLTLSTIASSLSKVL